MLATTKVYEEIVDLIAGVSPQDIVDFRPSKGVRERVEDLIARDKTVGLSADEKSELNHYLQAEHLMTLAKARARRCLANE